MKHCLFYSIFVLLIVSCQEQSSSSLPSDRPKSLLVVEENSPLVLFLGDSLTAAYQLSEEEGYPFLLEQRWLKRKISIRVQNAGVSADTTQGVLSRLDWVMGQDIHFVFLAIGSNDGFRGIETAKIEKNIEKIIEHIQAKNCRVVLSGMKLPPNYGKEYTSQFEAIFPRVAQKYDVSFYPFLLEEVAGRENLNLSDGIHPNAQGHEVIASKLEIFFQEEGIVP